MNKFKYLTLTILLSSLCLSQVSASCTKEEIDAFKEIEDEYTVTYEFDKETKTYTLYLTNPNMKSYAYEHNIEKYEKVTKTDESTMKIIGISAGEYILSVRGNNESCNNKLKTFNIKLNKYNSYSEDELCNGIEEFVLCQETYEKEIDYDTFVSRVNTYKKTKKQEESKIEEKDDVEAKQSTINKLTDYLRNNYTKIIIIITFVVLLIITIVISTESIKKSRRLE